MFKQNQSHYKITSKQPSRSASRGPNADDDLDGLLSDVNFGNLDELISLRLSTLLNDDDDAKSSSGGTTNNTSDQAKGSTIKFKLNSIPEIIKTLQKSRNEVSSQDRELLLNQLYYLIIKKPNLDQEYDDVDYETDLINLYKILQSSKSNELILAIRAITAFIITNIDNAGILYSEDKSLSILDYLEKKIIDLNLSISTRQYLIYSYTALTLVIFDGSGGYGVESSLDFLLETLLGITNNTASNDLQSNIPIISSIIYGLGSLLTLLSENANLNEIIENLLQSSSNLLTDYDILEINKPMSMLFGLCYEIFDYNDSIGDKIDDDDDDESEQYNSPYDNTYEIKTRLEELIKSNTKKLSKKDKKEGRSVFRDVQTTINFYSNKESRLLKLSSKKSDQDDYQIQDELVLSHLKLSKSRSLAIKSWFAFFRLIQLKWVFGSGLHNQLANNSRIGSIIRDKPNNDYANKFNDELSGGDDDGEYWNDSRTNKLTHKKLDQAIDHRRKVKMNVGLEQQGMLD
ncbi:hypothetical protein BN7_2182 [Wickerhamomyces ciferrii]|uniref:Interferon-related developmental regulator N-terminal domain-containing protein n=1 Tax=Wickerhamomyces ciferrii (strain ATCC 14091 / BCRC 22168 / CBS 111 / JCM 3599 / NBRC 0793 / NRRL Y-1031 F-60-10) TaxID=1206466 RepID=K0KND8_WICCF|nr:uncharacterized protein BN7_2182 [Wickerhamomyces ciferrii]CCH42638.1 hypothetical protein BN7_2182 [Wickerhamomyces ciferrii]